MTTQPPRWMIILSPLLLVLPAHAANAQASAVHRTILQDQDFPPPAFHTTTVRVVVDTKGIVARHTHPGVEMAYITAGRAILTIAGQPDRTLSAGESFSIPPGTVHSVRNAGPDALVIISTYVVEKDKPIASPAP
jgi:quercetin dioxygenase-like cupin family protein